MCGILATLEKMRWIYKVLRIEDGNLWKIVVNSTNVSERKTENQESDVNLQLELPEKKAHLV